MNAIASREILTELQTDILRLQGFESVNHLSSNGCLGSIRNSFPNQSFPLGTVHEFISTGGSDAAATSGFVCGLLSAITGGSGISLWISASRKIFPPALKSFGLDPDRFIFVDVQNEKEAMWAVDEALKCPALSAVVGEVQEISFTASQRLQLSVEQSQVTVFVIRNNIQKLNPTACNTRWRITPLPSEAIDDLPGLGFPKWRVELLKVRNGQPGKWDIQWVDSRFFEPPQVREITARKEAKTG